MAEIVKSSFKIVGNKLTITLEDGIEDNFQYEIRIRDLKSLKGNYELDEYIDKVVTKLSPSYCNISDVAILIDTFNIPESTVLYYIREASKYVDYIMNKTSANGGNKEITFPMREFVKVKCMIDCLMKAYVHKAAGSGIKGKLGEISFEDTEKYASSIDDILDDLWRQLKGWEDALKGYEREGRVPPTFAVKAQKTSKATPFSSIADSIERDMPTV